jgi:hypothetical protein
MDPYCSGKTHAHPLPEREHFSTSRPCRAANPSPGCSCAISDPSGVRASHRQGRTPHRLGCAPGYGVKHLRDMTIGQLAKRAVVNVETIRFYQRRACSRFPAKAKEAVRRAAYAAMTRPSFGACVLSNPRKPQASRSPRLENCSSSMPRLIAPARACRRAHRRDRKDDGRTRHRAAGAAWLVAPVRRGRYDALPDHYGVRAGLTHRGGSAPHPMPARYAFGLREELCRLMICHLPFVHLRTLVATPARSIVSPFVRTIV